MDTITACDTVGTPDDVSSEAITARYELLSVWPRSLAESATDPRCGCSADNEGGSCWWDSLTQLELL